MNARILIPLLIFISTLTFGQQRKSTIEKAKFNGDLKKYVGTRLHYPVEMQERSINGEVIAFFKIDSLGKMDSLSIVQSPHKQLSTQVLKILANAPNSWSPTMIDNLPVSYWYRFVVEFKLRDGPKEKASYFCDRAKSKFSKNKNDDALELINKALLLRPYEDKYYKLRSDIFKAKGNTLQAQQDSIKFKQLRKSFLASVWVEGYSITTKRAISTSTNNF